MPTLPANKSVACATCAKPFTYVVRYFAGEEVFTPTDCPACCDAERATLERVAKESARQQREIVYRKLDLPFPDTVIARLPSPRSQIVLKWAHGPKGLYCHGPSGLGKTRTIIELLKRLWVEDGREFTFISWPSWQNKLEAAHRYGGAGKYREVTPLQNAPILAMDDCGKGKVTESVVTAFFSIIDHRTSRGLPTFLTSKYPITRAAGSPLEIRLAEGSADVARDVVRRITEFSFNAPFAIP